MGTQKSSPGPARPDTRESPEQDKSLEQSDPGTVERTVGLGDSGSEKTEDLWTEGTGNT